jgi:hypothetical protein
LKLFDATISAELQKEILQYFFLLELQLTTTYRFTDGDVPIYEGGYLFSPRAFSFDNFAGSSSLAVEKIEITIDDTDQAISALLLGEDVRNKIAKLYLGVIARTHVIGTEWDIETEWAEGNVWAGDYEHSNVVAQEMFQGFIGGWELYDDAGARLSLTNELVLWNKKTLRTQSTSCPWAFKGTECAYAGSEIWCDQSYDRCTALVNSANFGGFRFLSSLMEKEIWWGKTPKV